MHRGMVRHVENAGRRPASCGSLVRLVRLASSFAPITLCGSVQFSDAFGLVSFVVRASLSLQELCAGPAGVLCGSIHHELRPGSLHAAERGGGWDDERQAAEGLRRALWVPGGRLPSSQCHQAWAFSSSTQRP